MKSNNLPIVVDERGANRHPNRLIGDVSNRNADLVQFVRTDEFRVSELKFARTGVVCAHLLERSDGDVSRQRFARISNQRMGNGERQQQCRGEETKCDGHKC